MYTETYGVYPHYSPSGYGLHKSSQALYGCVPSTDQISYPTAGGGQVHSQLPNPTYHQPLQADVHHQYLGYTDSTQTLCNETHAGYAPCPVETHTYEGRNPVSHGVSVYSPSAICICTTTLPLHSPHSVSAASAPLLSPSYATPPASSYLPSEHHLAGLEGPRRMSVPELHSQHHQTGYVQTQPFHAEASRRMSVPNLHCHNEASGSYRPSVSRLDQSQFTLPNTAELASVYASPDYGAHPTSSSTASKAQLAPQGSSTDLMEYYANLEREAFQTPCQLLDTLLKTSSSGYSQVDPVPVEQLREEKKQTETSRQARLRYMSESIGFQPTDPDTLSCHEKKRYYIESLEIYIGWLRTQCELIGVDVGGIQRFSSYRGLSTRSVRTMIVHMQKMLRTDHIKTLKEEGDFLHLREQVLAQEERANAASHARRGF